MINPYADCGGTWVRGNLHGHCSESSGCASVRLFDGIEKHRTAGARFLALTDHDTVTDLSAARARWPDMTFLEGFEWSRSQNILFIGDRVPPLFELSLSEAMRKADGLLTVICHPRPSLRTEYWTVPMILALDPAPVGIEVYNSHYCRPLRTDPGPNPLYTDTWDALLTQGLRVWGFVNDDSHDPADFGRTATFANVRDLSSGSLIGALKSGRFYGSTGLGLDEVFVSGDAISVRLDGEARGRFVGPGGRVQGASEGREFSLRAVDGDYVRFEAEGGKGRIFLQPFFSSVSRSRAAGIANGVKN
jgi:hypothetical protein